MKFSLPEYPTPEEVAVIKSVEMFKEAAKAEIKRLTEELAKMMRELAACKANTELNIDAIQAQIADLQKQREEIRVLKRELVEATHEAARSHNTCRAWIGECADLRKREISAINKAFDVGEENKRLRGLIAGWADEVERLACHLKAGLPERMREAAKEKR